MSILLISITQSTPQSLLFFHPSLYSHTPKSHFKRIYRALLQYSVDWLFLMIRCWAPCVSTSALPKHSTGIHSCSVHPRMRFCVFLHICQIKNAFHYNSCALEDAHIIRQTHINTCYGPIKDLLKKSCWNMFVYILTVIIRNGDADWSIVKDV